MADAQSQQHTESLPNEGMWSLLRSFLHTGAIRVETEADVDGARVLCFVSTIQLDGDWLLEIDHRVTDRRDLFGLHRSQVLLRLQRLRRLNTIFAVLPWGSTIAALATGLYTDPGEWLTISGYGLGSLVGMTLLRGLAGRIIGWVIRRFGRLSRIFGAGADSA